MQGKVSCLHSSRQHEIRDRKKEEKKNALGSRLYFSIKSERKKSPWDVRCNCAGVNVRVY
jgi:hypothetical protein